MPPWIDITMPFGHPAGTWPGDAPLDVEWTARPDDPDRGVNLCRFSSSPHNGTHSDAPYHVDPEGAQSEALPLENYLGLCEVVDATRFGGEPLAAAFAVDVRAPRVLFQTRRGPVPEAFPDNHTGLSEALARMLASRRTLLVGTDAPSVDHPGAQGLPVHKILFAAGTVLLENLDLSRVDPGRYELLALPLKVRGLCAAPVRALLRRA